LVLEKIEGALCVWFRDGGWHGTIQGVSEHAEEEKATIDHVFFTKSSVSSSIMHSVTFDHTDNIQSETVIPGSTSTYVCMFINL
jgi:hypothetical protein